MEPVRCQSCYGMVHSLSSVKVRGHGAIGVRRQSGLVPDFGCRKCCWCEILGWYRCAKEVGSRLPLSYSFLRQRWNLLVAVGASHAGILTVVQRLPDGHRMSYAAASRFPAIRKCKSWTNPFRAGTPRSESCCKRNSCARYYLRRNIILPLSRILMISSTYVRVVRVIAQ